MKINYRRFIKPLLIVTGISIIVVNGLIFMHARALTHFTDGGEKTPRPEELSFTDKLQILFVGATVPKPRNLRSPKDFNLEYESHWIESNPDLRLASWYIPNQTHKGMVIIFPGYGQPMSSMLLPAKNFHDKGYDVFMIDFRGAGDSSGNITSLGYDESDDVVQASNYAKKLLPEGPANKTILYGSSMGSAAIMRAIAVSNLKPDAIILENPFDSLSNAVRNRVRTVGMPSFPAAELMVFWGGISVGYNGFDHNPVEYAKSVKCPTLFMHGDKDVRTTAEQAQTIFDNLAGKKTLVWFRGIGHTLLAKSQPDVWDKHVSEFLNR